MWRRVTSFYEWCRKVVTGGSEGGKRIVSGELEQEHLVPNDNCDEKQDDELKSKDFQDAKALHEEDAAEYPVPRIAVVSAQSYDSPSILGRKYAAENKDPYTEKLEESNASLLMFGKKISKRPRIQQHITSGRQIHGSEVHTVKSNSIKRKYVTSTSGPYSIFKKSRSSLSDNNLSGNNILSTSQVAWNFTHQNVYSVSIGNGHHPANTFLEQQLTTASFIESHAEATSSSIVKGQEKILGNTGTACKEATAIGKLVNQDELDIICSYYDRKDQLVVRNCESICNMIKCSSEYVIHVYAAYKKENERKIFFVVTVMWDFDLNENDIGYRMIKRNYGDLSTEGIDISSSIEEREQIMSDDENKKLSACISKYAEKLMDSHKYLNIISGSFVRSKNYKPSAMCLSKEFCMALYVLVKGFIPIEEDAFQKTYDGVSVDIREGLYFPYGTAREFHGNIKMGCRITRLTGLADVFGGTLGGFIDHPKYGICGITCAHALMFPDELKKCVENNGEISWPQIFSSDIVCQPDPVEVNKIGRIVQAIYKEGDQSEAGVEVALIQIEDRPPISGQFPDVGSNGSSVPYTFESGKTCGVTRFMEKDLYKFGCTSDLTVGRLKTTPVCVRSFEFKSIGFTLKLCNQLELRTEGFATHGDSGSLVFCEGMSGDFECIGMVEGGVSYKTCILTPIHSILTALKVSSLKEFESTTRKKQLDAIENRVSSIETKVDSMYSLLLSFTQKNSNDEAK